MKEMRETFTSKSFVQKLNNSGVGLKVPKNTRIFTAK